MVSLGQFEKQKQVRLKYITAFHGIPNLILDRTRCTHAGSPYLKFIRKSCPKHPIVRHYTDTSARCDPGSGNRPLKAHIVQEGIPVGGLP